jgi:hypothetical protein
MNAILRLTNLQRVLGPVTPLVTAVALHRVRAT